MKKIFINTADNNFKKNEAKRSFYISVFIVLGILLQFLIHAVVEIWYIDLLIQDFSKYNLGLSWNQWFLAHHIGSFVLLIAGTLLGLWQGKFWWKKKYNNK